MIAVPRRRPLGARRLLVTYAFVAAAMVFVTALLAESPSDTFGWDFRYQYYTGARSVLEGTPLYIVDERALAEALDGLRSYVYPPLSAVALVPLALLGPDAATLAMLLLSLAALVGSLAAVGVRDVRCYAVVLLWPPAIGAFTVLNVTPFLVLALALAWRTRSRALPLAAALGLGIAAKLLLWPLVVWAACSRRALSAGLALAVALVATLASWALAGFQGLQEYPRILRTLEGLHAENSYSLLALVTELGLEGVAGRLLSLALGLGVLAVAARLARAGDERRSFTWAVVASLALSPIVWLHYLLLLAVPLAIARPRLSWPWLLPLVLWVSPDPGYVDGPARFLPAAVTALLVAAVSARRARPAVAREAVA